MKVRSPCLPHTVVLVAGLVCKCKASAHEPRAEPDAYVCAPYQTGVDRGPWLRPMSAGMNCLGPDKSSAEDAHSFADRPSATRARAIVGPDARRG